MEVLLIVVTGCSPSGGHPPAAFCTAAAGIDAFLHVADLFAAPGALLTDFSADRASAHMKLGADQHEVRRGLTNLGAGDHEPEMIRLDMLAACFQAMIHRHREADAMATQAFVDAVSHLWGNLMHRGSPLQESAGIQWRQARRRPSPPSTTQGEGLASTDHFRPLPGRE